jgi:PTS system galactitol-specific IIC component
MVLMPKIIGLFMESLSAISEVSKKFFAEKFKGRELYIGLDSAILIGHPITVAAAVVMIPIVVLLSLFLPGNRVLALGDLAALVYFVAMVPALSKGNLFRSIVCGTVIMTMVLYILTMFGSSLTIMAIDAGVALPEGATDMTALSAGNWITAIFFQIGRLFGG